MDVAVGHRGSVLWTGGIHVPDEWIELGTACNIQIPRRLYDFLPDLSTRNSRIVVPGEVEAITFDLEGVCDMDVNIDISDWFTVAATTSAEVVLKLTSARSYTFDAFMGTIGIPRRNGDLTTWTAACRWDGVSAVVIA